MSIFDWSSNLFDLMKILEVAILHLINIIRRSSLSLILSAYIKYIYIHNCHHIDIFIIWGIVYAVNNNF